MASLSVVALDPWRKTLVARHPDRPHCRDYVDALFSEWTPLAGDRTFGDDHAVMGGLARFNDAPCVVIGHEKGNDTKSRIHHNFGMARPEGYRKAIRLMDLADRFGLPIHAIGLGESIDDLAPFDPGEFARALTGL